MRITATDNLIHQMELARTLDRLAQQRLKLNISHKLAEQENFQQTEKLNRRQRELELDQLYWERALSKTRQLKGSQVDLLA